MARKNWPYSGHRTLMSGVGPVFPTHSQTSHNDVRNRTRKNWPYSGHLFCNENDVRNRASDVQNSASDVQNTASDSGIGSVMSGTGPVMSGIGPKKLVTFQISHIDVRNMARKN